MLEIRTLGPADPAFAAWHEVIRAAYADGREPGWWESLEATRRYFTDPGARTGHVALAAAEEGVVVGGAELGLPLDEDTHTMSVELGVAPSRRRHGVGGALAARVGELAEQERRDVIQAELLVPAGVDWADWPGGRFAQRYRLRSVSSEDRFLLDLPVDDRRLRELEASLPAAEDGAVTDRIVSWLGPCPDDHLAEWARM